MWRRRCLAFRIDFEDSGASDNVLVREVRGGFGENDVNLANGSCGDGIDLEILVAGCNADFDWELDVPISGNEQI